jgi:hypothetical protein
MVFFRFFLWFSHGLSIISMAFDHISGPSLASHPVGAEGAGAEGATCCAGCGGGTLGGGGLRKGAKTILKPAIWEWLVVSNMTWICSISYMGCHPSHWRTPSFFKTVIAPATSNDKPWPNVKLSYFSRWLNH